ncbi:MAG: MGMT family protein [Candidatus Melainabacteria bacterium]|nr:MGMT family protein [Candidatus Melainabacteria bacterium]
MSKVYDQVYKLVCLIPPGKVLTYGLVSYLIDRQLSAQGVGWALAALASHRRTADYSVANVPWHRIINSRGGLSTYKNLNIAPNLQRQLLEAEGVTFDQNEHVNLQKHLWTELTDLSKIQATTGLLR